MPIEIRELVTEVVIRGPEDGAADAGPDGRSTSSAEADARTEAIVRQAVERVMDLLRREWER